MQRVLDFLRDLHDHNDRAWFNANKGRYLEAKAVFEEFALDLASRIRAFDESIGPLSIGDITYRIYRDTRFSKDKSPYKCHMGVFICPGGKKSGYSGYYFHVSAAMEGGWETGHIMAVGDYMCEPKVMKLLREDIAYGDGEFRRILSQVDDRFSLDTSCALKRVPQGFPTDSPDSEFFKLRNLCLCHYPDEAFVTAPGLAARLAEMFRTAQPFLAFVNRAIEYSREEC